MQKKGNLMKCKDCKFWEDMTPGIGWCSCYMEFVCENGENCESFNELSDKDVRECH